MKIKKRSFENEQISEKEELMPENEKQEKQEKQEKIVYLWCNNCKKELVCSREIPVYICCQSCGCLDLRAKDSLEFECRCGNKRRVKEGEKVFCECGKMTMIFR